MPWDAASFKEKSKKLSSSEAGPAAEQANAILRSGAPEGVAIATALKHANALKRAKAK